MQWMMPSACLLPGDEKMDLNRYDVLYSFATIKFVEIPLTDNYVMEVSPQSMYHWSKSVDYHGQHC
jgi:hypothetical protein